MKNKKLTKFEVLGFSNNSSTSTIVETRPYFYNEFPTFSKNLKLLIVLLLGIHQIAILHLLIQQEIYVLKKEIALTIAQHVIQQKMHSLLEIHRQRI